MRPAPWNWGTIVGLAALAVVIGVSVAHCDHHEQPQAPAHPCVDVAGQCRTAFHPQEAGG